MYIYVSFCPCPAVSLCLSLSLSLRLIVQPQHSHNEGPQKNTSICLLLMPQSLIPLRLLSGTASTCPWSLALKSLDQVILALVFPSVLMLLFLQLLLIWLPMLLVPLRQNSVVVALGLPESATETTDSCSLIPKRKPAEAARAAAAASTADNTATAD